MIGRDAVFDFEGMEEGQLPIGVSAHDGLPSAMEGV
jgi:hypothetical protein